MPQFTVYGGHDAYAVYKCVVEADSADEARQLALDKDQEWKPTGDITEFDDFTVFTEEGSVEPYEPPKPNFEAAAAVYKRAAIMSPDEHRAIIDNDETTVVLTPEERDIIIAALRLWQASDDEIGQDIYDLALNGRDTFLTDREIDTLIEGKING